MKGYTTLSVEEARSSLAVYEARKVEAQQTRSEGIKRFYKKFYTEEAGWYTRWRHKNSSDIDFCHSRMGSFDRWADLLHVVLTHEETDLVDWLDWNGGYREAGKIESLAGASTTTIMIDDELCRFINKYR